MQAHPLDGHLPPDRQAMVLPLLSLIHTQLRGVAEWAVFGDDKRCFELYQRPCNAQLAFPLSLGLPRLVRRVIVARLIERGSMDEAWVRAHAAETYRCLASLLSSSSGDSDSSSSFLLGPQPCSADVALYAHLHTLAIRHGPPAEWIRQETPVLIGYYHRMRNAAEKARQRASNNDISNSVPSDNAFEQLAATMDARFKLLAEAQRAGNTDDSASASSSSSSPRSGSSLLDPSGRWGYDRATVHAAAVDSLTSGAGQKALVRDAVVTVGIFAVAAVLIKAVVKGGRL